MRKIAGLVAMLLLITVAVLAFSLSGSAAGNPCTEVKIGTTTLNASNKTLSAGGGTASFDPATGTLTLNNVQGIDQISSVEGDLTILAVGTNTLSTTKSFVVNTDLGNLTFGGTGSLSMTGTTYGVYAKRGSMTFQDGVTVSVKTGSTYVLGNSGENDIVFTGSSKVTLEGTGDKLIFHNNIGSNKVSVQQTAQVTVKAPSCTAGNVLSIADLEVLGGTLNVTMEKLSAYGISCKAFRQTAGTVTLKTVNAGADAMYCTAFEKSGGDMSVEVNGNASVTKIQGIFVAGNDDTVATFGGGTMTFTMNSVNPAASHLHALYFHHLKKANFSGTEFTFNINTPNVGTFSSAILTGWSQEISMTGGKIVANLNDKTTGLICPRYAMDDFVLNVSGGTVTGTAPSLLNTNTGTDGTGVTTSVAVNIKDGAKIKLSTPGGVFSSANKYTVVTSGSNASFADGCGLSSAGQWLITANMFSSGNYLTGVQITDVKGTVTLNYGTRVYHGTVGRIVLDPDAKTLLLDGVVGPKSVSVPGDATVTVWGTNEIGGGATALSSDGNLTVNGTGTLELTGSSKVLSAKNLTVNGPSLYVAASSGTALEATSLTGTGTSRLRFLSEGGNAVTVSSVRLSDSVKAKIYADQGEGLSLTDLTLSNGAELTVDAKGTGVSATGTIDLSGNAWIRIYSEGTGLDAKDSSVRKSGNATLTVLKD